MLHLCDKNVSFKFLVTCDTKIKLVETLFLLSIFFYNAIMVNDKKILVIGLANKYSIAASICDVLYEQGAELAFSYQNERFEKFINSFAATHGDAKTFVCDLSNDSEIKHLIKNCVENWGEIDGIVHSVGFSPADQISGNIEDCITREGFAITHDISSYSFAAIVKEAAPYMSKSSSIITLTYIGSQEATPNYNVMGMAKASLEASVRYFSASLGSKGIRVNAVSAGPIKTLAASGIKGFKSMLNKHGKETPLGRNITAKEVGNTSTFLLSDLSSGITGQVIYVDGGYNIQAMKFD